MGLRDKYTVKAVIHDIEAKQHSMNKIICAIYGSESGHPIEEFKKAYGVTDLAIKDKNFLNKAIVHILNDNVNNYALYNYCQSERKRGSVVWMYIFEHHNPNIISHLSFLLPFNGELGTLLVIRIPWGDY